MLASHLRRMKKSEVKNHLHIFGRGDWRLWLNSSVFFLRFFLPPYAKACFKPMSAELHRTSGTFWRTLYRLSYRAAAIPLSYFSWVRGPPTTTLLVFETLCSCITRDFDLSALSIELPRTRRRLSTLATWLTKTEFRETKHHSILERKKCSVFWLF